jgi:hypothetical protein
MIPFTVQQIWHAGHPVPVAECRGSVLALLLEATIQRITAAVASRAGCPCCRCSTPIRRIAHLHCATVAVGQTDVEEFRTLARLYCARCAPDPQTAEARAACEHGAMALRFRLRAPATVQNVPRNRPISISQRKRARAGAALAAR